MAFGVFNSRQSSWCQISSKPTKLGWHGLMAGVLNCFNESLCRLLPLLSHCLLRSISVIYVFSEKGMLYPGMTISIALFAAKYSLLNWCKFFHFRNVKMLWNTHVFKVMSWNPNRIYEAYLKCDIQQTTQLTAYVIGIISFNFWYLIDQLRSTKLFSGFITRRQKSSPVIICCALLLKL